MLESVGIDSSFYDLYSQNISRTFLVEIGQVMILVKISNFGWLTLFNYSIKGNEEIYDKDNENHRKLSLRNDRTGHIKCPFITGQ